MVLRKSSHDTSKPLAMPKDFTQRDADRMYASLKTQIDDEGEEVPA